MLDYLKQEAGRHRESARRLFRATPFWVVFVPAICVAALIYLHQSAIAPYLTKSWDEFVSPPVLFVGFLVALATAWLKPHPFYNWLAVLGFCLFLRELHFYGTNNGFYIAFVVLMLWASKNRDAFEPFLSTRRVVALFMTVIWLYLVSKTFDRHYWDFLVGDITGNDLFEENLELAGHLLFVVLTIVSAMVAV